MSITVLEWFLHVGLYNYFQHQSIQSCLTKTGNKLFWPVQVTHTHKIHTIRYGSHLVLAYCSNKTTLYRNRTNLLEQ